jgi:hypothetical protein
MLKFLARLVGCRDPLVKMGRRLSGEDFVRSIALADVYVIAAMQSKGHDPATLTQEEMLAEIERVARDLGEREGDFEVFIYQQDGRPCLPFFSSLDQCQTFCGEYSKQENRVIPFQILGVKGSALAGCARGVERVILNDWTPDERPLSDEETRLLQETWS